jgi:hypothetical protein
MSALCHGPGVVTKEDVVMAQGTVKDLVRDAMIVKLDPGPLLGVVLCMRPTASSPATRSPSS